MESSREYYEDRLAEVVRGRMHAASVNGRLPNVIKLAKESENTSAA